jgi:hypothetical protein
MLIPTIPDHNFLTLKEVRKCTVTLVDLQGNEVFKTICENDNLHINVTGFKDACYILCVSLGLEVMSRKLLVWKK